MNCVKGIKKFFALVLAFMMISSITAFSAEAASSERVAHELYYTTYNEKNEIVEEGIIPVVKEGSRYTWSSSIKLENGWYTSFRKPGPRAFYAVNGTDMTFSYKLNRSAKIEYYFYRDSTADTFFPKEWKTGTKTSSGASITKTADKNAYYHVGVTNVSSDDIIISNVSFVF